ncbi:hypothetical protein [Streptomyces subrutilus]|uniref:Uncharacterized protein n=1 Tax=Streptomyces subrutilus TaxID=36818 RepID=A0A1E5NXI6_9ACTN|nr:hypothetical protein [Streptomyces subrutilus]OEJ20949.1 hypothetical protein BGK67_35125 [Streptomyces subrutilus]
MSEADWTPDAIAHALPTPDMRVEFWRQLNLTKFDELEALGARWRKVIEDLEAAADRGRQVHAHQLQHGELPSSYQDVTTLVTERQVA